MVAGHATTTHLLGNGVALLAGRPQLLEQLRRQPELIGAFVEEVLRFESPLQIRVRRCLRPVQFHGRTLSPGTLVMAIIGAANRDPRKFREPERFDLNRDTSGHLGFGNGIHGCLGAGLARLEGGIALSILVGRLDAIELDADDRPSLLTDDIAMAWRGYRRLPIRVVGG